MSDTDRPIRPDCWRLGGPLSPEEAPHIKSSLQDARDLRDALKLSHGLLGLRDKTGQSYRELYDLLYGS